MTVEVHTHMGILPNGKYSVAVFVIDIDGAQPAHELATEVKAIVEEKVKEKLRHGLHIVANDEHLGGPILD